jgi:hypothetical protein
LTQASSLTDALLAKQYAAIRRTLKRNASHFPQIGD